MISRRRVETTNDGEPRGNRIPPIDRSVRALFSTWRRILSSALASVMRAISSGTSRVLRHSRAAWGSRTVALDSLRATLSGSADASRGPASTPVKWALAAIGIGTIFTLLISVPGGRSGPAVAGFLLGAAWLSARLVVMRAVAPRHGVGGEIVTRAWAASALPYALAVVPGLRFLAWGVGAALAIRALRLNGVEPRTAAVLTAWGHGAEAAGVVVVWVTRGLLVAALFPAA